MEVLLISQFLGNYSYLLKTKLSNENNFVHSCKLELTITNLSIILFKVWNVIVNVKCEEGGWALLSGGGGWEWFVPHRAVLQSLSTVSYDCDSWSTQPCHRSTPLTPWYRTSLSLNSRWEPWLTSAGLFYCYWPLLLLEQVRKTLTKMFSGNTTFTMSIKLDTW